MNNVTRVFIGLLGLILLLLIGVVAGRVGGIAIRNNFIGGADLELSVVQPAVRGVPVSARWSTSALEPGEVREAMLYFRDEQSELVVGRAVLSDGQAMVEFPCEVASSSGSLIVRDDLSNEVLSTAIIGLLPPGPECVL